eukprot:3931607-Rhodomonas_salina.3
MAPIVGEVPFFLGINHPFNVRNRPDGSGQLLVLTKEESAEVFSGRSPKRTAATLYMCVCMCACVRAILYVWHAVVLVLTRTPGTSIPRRVRAHLREPPTALRPGTALYGLAAYRRAYQNF